MHAGNAGDFNDNHLKIFHINVQCLSNKIDMLSFTLEGIKSDIVCISEHWYTSDSLKDVVINGYSLQASFCRSARLHGGVAIYARDGLVLKDAKLSGFSVPFQAEFAGVELPVQGYLVMVVYRSSSCGKFNIFFECLDRLLTAMFRCCKKIIILGDFNCDPDKHPNEANTLSNIMTSYRLIPTIQGYTRVTSGSASCLDNIYINFGFDNFKTSIYDPGISDHAGQIISILKEPSVTQPSFRYTKVVSFSGLVRLKAALSQFDWETLCLEYKDADEGMKVFLDFLEESMKQCCVIRTSKIRVNGASPVSWYNDELRAMRSTLGAIKSVFNATQNTSDWNTYVSYRSLYRKRISETKKSAYNNFILSSQNKQKSCWKIVNGNRVSKKTDKIKSAGISVNEFNSYFSKVADTIVRGLQSPDSTGVDTVDLIPIHSSSFFLAPVSPSEIFNVIWDLKNKNGFDYYCMNARVMKFISNEITQPLTNLINNCIMQGVFPHSLKINKVVPIYKKGDLKDVGNYRPIAISPIIAKIFETVLKRRLLDYFERQRILSPQQFGFREGSSTTDAVLKLLESVVEGFDGGCRTEVTLCDLTKAFDCVSVPNLLNKLEAYGVRGVCLRLLESYLTDRRQFVSLNGEVSETLPQVYGVPQGSIVGPLLFLVYINDLPQHVSDASTLLFADDTTLFTTHRDIGVARASMQSAVVQTSNWFAFNKMKLNKKKTQTITLATDKNIAAQTPVCLLGIRIDQRLTWVAHVDQVCARISSGLYVLRNLYSLLSLDVLKMAYYALVHSHLAYAVILWGGSAESQRAFVMQKRAVRVLLGKGFREHCRPLFKSLGILTLPSLYILETCLYVHKRSPSLRTRSDVHNHNTRGRDLLVIPSSKTCTSEKNKIDLGLYNRLPSEFKTLTFSAFKSKIRRYLNDHSFYSVAEYLKKG